MIHLVQPGWYDDPFDAEAIRWWDGQRWSDQGRRPTLRENWRAWISRSRRARRVSQVLVPLDAVAALISLSIVLLALIRRRATSNLVGLLVLGGPLVAIGQVWTILLANSRMPRRPRGFANRVRERVGRSTNLVSHPIQIMFGGLSRRYLAPIAVCFVAGWLVAMTAFPDLKQGGSSQSAECPYPLESHGVISCVSRAAYERADAGQQRFAAGILAAFFCVHLAAALGHLIGRYRPAEP